jgi:PAS domain S-box-containing protein
MEPRFEEINKLLINYSLGEFDYKIKPSDNYDEIDAFIVNINMLGEELKASTISKNYFNNIFHSIADKLFVLDNTGKITDINKAVQEKLGYKDEEILRNSIDFLSGEQGQFNTQVKKQMHSANSIAHWETIIYSSKKEPIPVFCSCSYLHNQIKEKVGYLLIVRDISDIKKYQKSLVESEKKYRDIFEKSSDCLFVIDVLGKFIDLNKAGFELFKLSGETSATANFFEHIIDGNEKDFFNTALHKAGQVIDFKLKVIDSKSNIIDCLVSANNILTEKNTVIGYQGIIKDVSEQKNLENLVVKTIVDTQEQERKRIARDLHDGLGQQLSAIKFYLGSLKSMQNGSKNVKYDEILSKSNNALSTVLKELSNISFNLMPGTLQNFGLGYAIKELCNKRELNDLMKFDVDIDNDFVIHDKTIEITLFRITQEFINNSIKHGNAGKVRIKMHVNNKSNKIEILLRDNGKGFEIKKIREYTGMGLKNIQSRVESHNGILKINSEINKGTTYEIMIPYSYIQNEKIKNINNR